jgi:hypothetical protein
MANNVNQRQFLALKLEALSETEVGEVLDYITTLADARENRRARQAFEWEAVRRKAEKRAAARVGAQV